MDLEEHVEDPHPSSSFSSASSNYAFVSLSQDHLPLHVLQPSSDNSSFARRRRRRTSPHDQVILEEEYRKCTKPDKTRRKEICKRVQMGEKEVQIWFCNKRQAERRRATPLQPHEMVPNRERSSMTRGHSHHDPTAATQGTSFASELPTSLASSPPGHVSRTHPRLYNHHREFPSEISVPSPSAFINSSPYLASNVKPRLAIDDDDRYLHSDIRDRDIVSYSDSEREAELPTTKPRMTVSPPEPLASLKPLMPLQLLRAQGPQEPLNPLDPQAPKPATKPPLKIKPLFPAPKSVPSGAKTTTSAHRRLQDALNTNPQPQPRPTSSHAGHTANPLAPHPRRTNPTTIPPLLRRSSSSLLRLATSMEGKAVVVLAGVEPPSSPPNRPLMHPDRPLMTTPKKLPGSRPPIDTKLWEFACENQRGILSPSATPPLPDEASYAVRLMRSRSRINLAGAGNGGGSGAAGAAGAAGGLGAAGLVNGGGTLPTPKKSHPHPHPHPPKPSSKKRTADTSLESDKENRPPGVLVSPPVELRRKKKKGKITSQADKIRGILRGDKSKWKGNAREKESEGGKEKGAAEETGKGENIWNDRRIDEIECVENLLSLQRGSWR